MNYMKAPAGNAVLLYILARQAYTAKVAQRFVSEQEYQHAKFLHLQNDHGSISKPVHDFLG